MPAWPGKTDRACHRWNLLETRCGGIDWSPEQSGLDTRTSDAAPEQAFLTSALTVGRRVAGESFGDS